MKISANNITASARTPNTTPSAIPSFRSLESPAGSGSSVGSGSLVLLSSVVTGRLTSILEIADADVEVDKVDEPDVDVELAPLIYVEDPMTTELGQVSAAISDTVVEG